MKVFFADTFYFVALLSPSDKCFEMARRFTVGQAATLVTTPWVLLELANALAKSKTRGAFVETWDALQFDEQVIITELTDESFHRGIELYRARKDKNWSLTDCISFTVMNERGITDALTGDHHFEQAGFRTLLK